MAMEITSNYSSYAAQSMAGSNTKKKETESASETEEGTEEKVQEESAYNKAERLLEEKIAVSKDGTIYLNDVDMKTIIEAAQEEDAGKTTVKDRPQVGANLDLKI